jgi:hypothetical protein
MIHVKRTISLMAIMIASISTHAQQAPAIEWQRCLGGSWIDQMTAIQQTTEGDLIVVGSSASTDGDLTGNHGGSDMWVAKLNGSGELLWQRNHGGSGNDHANSVQKTDDGGYVLAGVTSSNDGDVSGNHGGISDAWIVKLSEDGDIQWQRCFGGSGGDQLNAIRQTSDGGYLAVGFTDSDDGDVSGNHGGSDAWVIKLDPVGELQWQRCLGGSGNEGFGAVEQVAAGGYIMAGSTTSTDGDVTSNQGQDDAWVVKLNVNGEIVWQRTLGGSSYDWAIDILENPDGSYVMVGETYSNDGDVSGSHGNGDAWVVKLSADGELVWQRCYGGGGLDSANGIQRLSDNGFVFLGYTESNNGDVTGHQGLGDYWLVRLSGTGDLLWQQPFGGANSDSPTGMVVTSDGGYALVGFTMSQSGDVSGHHGGIYDGWVVKLSADPLSIEELTEAPPISLFPNPTHGEVAVDLIAINPAFVHSQLCDVAGRPLRVLFTGRIAAGGQRLQFSIADLPAGIYYVHVVLDGRATTQKVVKL